MSATKRLYCVKSKNETLLVKAVSPASALRVVVGSRYTVTVPSPMDVADLIGKGVAVLAPLPDDTIDPNTSAMPIPGLEINAVSI